MTAKIKLNAASGGGSISIQAPTSSSNNRVHTLPDATDGTILTDQSTLSSAKLSGALPAIDGSNLTGITAGVAGISSSADATAMTITSEERIGINRTNPSSASRLHVATTADVDYSINTAVTNAALVISNDAGNSGTSKCVGLSLSGGTPNGEAYITLVGVSSNESNLHFGMRSGNFRYDRVVFESNGRVRMPVVYGTAGSSMRDVQIESDGTLCGLSSITAAKTNIVDITDISWLYNLKPKKFNFRKKTTDVVTGKNTYLDEAETETSYGFLAEDVEKVNKDFCFYGKDEEGNDELAGVYYKTMVVPLIKAVQELKAENTALAARVTALEGA